ncbi:hypothetical protein KDX30_25910 [Pseudomonas sp. CDFA 553]|uniref:hypothetical protein n=1 Tax=Pseudomonas quasicaspiana TaxID=2829821 RepID=UPI001E50B150|nr:hypothetical protein [Pseudomonas quasicaspiana]MCD5991320.1 hypothetical protein [Pseudomonas quasicaspiana]
MLLRKLSRINSPLPVDFIPALMMKFNYETVNQMNASYPEPTVVEAPGGVLDPLNAMDGATVRVTYEMLDNDLVFLSWDDRVDLDTLKPGSQSKTLDFLVPREAVTDAMGRTIKVTYTVIRSGSAEPSIALDLEVDIDPRYPKPLVVDAPEGVLDPSDAANGATVRVTYEMFNTDLVFLSWDDQPDLLAPKPGNSSGTLEFLVPRTAVVDAMGRTVEVFYTVIRSGSAVPSIALDLAVGIDLRYPQPLVVEALDGVLDPQNAAHGATVRVTYEMLDTDLILLSWNGRVDLLVPKPGNSNGTLEFLVPRAAVVDAMEKTIEVLYTVIRSGAAQASIVLDLTVGLEQAEIKPVILTVTGASGEVKNGGETRDRILTITGTAGIGVTLDIFVGPFGDDRVVTQSDGSWTATITIQNLGADSIGAAVQGGGGRSDRWHYTRIE